MVGVQAWRGSSALVEEASFGEEYLCQAQQLHLRMHVGQAYRSLSSAADIPKLVDLHEAKWGASHVWELDVTGLWLLQDRPCMEHWRHSSHWSCSDSCWSSSLEV
jgi:hypothetical protein